MLSDEEKNAIEILKLRLENASLYVRGNNEVFYNALGIVLKLIEKQSKEIEKLKEKNKPQSDCEEPIERTEEMVNMKWVNHNYISKDKIKAKIEELEKMNIYEFETMNAIEVLQSLLEKE